MKHDTDNGQTHDNNTHNTNKQKNSTDKQNKTPRGKHINNKTHTKHKHAWAYNSRDAQTTDTNK